MSQYCFWLHSNMHNILYLPACKYVNDNNICNVINSMEIEFINHILLKLLIECINEFTNNILKSF